MADIIPPGYAEASIPLKHGGLARAAVITFGVELNDVPTTADANAMLVTWKDFMQSSLDASVTAGPLTYRVGQDGGEALVVPGSTTFQGTRDTTGSTPANLAMLLHKRTSRGGRRGRGRMYIPWVLADTDVDEVGAVLSSVVASWNTGLATLLINIQSTSKVDNMVVLHSPSRPGTENPTSPGSPNVVTTLVADPIIGTQRRRLGR